MTGRPEPRGLTRLDLAMRKRPGDVVVLAGAILLFDALVAVGPALRLVPFLLTAMPFVTMPLLRLVTARWRPNHSSEADLHGVRAGARRALAAASAMVGIGIWLRTEPSLLGLVAVVEVVISVWWLLSAIETIAIEPTRTRLHANAGFVATVRHFGRRLLVAICGGLGIVPAIITNTSGIAVAAVATKFVIAVQSSDRRPDNQAAAPVAGEAEQATSVPGEGKSQGAPPESDAQAPVPTVEQVQRQTAPAPPPHDTNQLRAGNNDIDLAPRGLGCSATIRPSEGGAPHVLDPLVLTQVTALARSLGEMFEIVKSESSEGDKVTIVVRFHGRGEESTITYDRKGGGLKSTSPTLPTSSPAPAPTTSTTVGRTTTSTTPTAPTPTTTSTTNPLLAALQALGALPLPAPGPTTPSTTPSSIPAATPSPAPSPTTAMAPTTTHGVGVAYLEAPTAPAPCEAIRSILAPLAERMTPRPR